ncbi:hypothetical protein BJ165DRAFT_1411341 [Panaeolus papilionaceus]|nr:hypothetical protein BJ165DRAFT_1411341 [Panaeolus papilionaceus]
MPPTRKAESDKERQVVPVTADNVRGRNVIIYLLTGKIESGKQGFVASLASPPDHLSIARSTFTSEVNAYRVVNWSSAVASDALDVILINTPDFSDPNMSEAKVITMISQKVDEIRLLGSQSAGHSHISVLYFTRITDPRIAGFQGKALTLAISLMDVFGASNNRMVVTMWDKYQIIGIDTADYRYKKFKSAIYKRADYENIDVMVLKFDNTRKSALSILDKASCGWNGGEVSRKGELRHEALVRNLLVERISSLLEELKYIQEDLGHPNTSLNQERKDTLHGRERDVSQILLSFYYNLYVVDPEFYRSQFPDAPFPPSPPSPPYLPSSKSRMEKVTGALKRFMPFSK